MHVGIAGPMDLALLQPHLSDEVVSRGYPFPLTSHLVASTLAAVDRVTAYTTDSGATKPYELHGPRLSVLVTPSRLRARNRALDFFREERSGLCASMRATSPDIVHAHWTYEFAMAARASGLPYLVTAHDWAPAILREHRDPYRAIRLLMQASVLARAPHVTAVSPYIARPIQRYFGRHAHVVPNGLLPDAFVASPPLRRSGPVIFGSLNAGPDRRKNMHALLQAFGVLSRDEGLVVPVTLRLGGPNHEPGSDLHRYAVSEGLDKSVEFVGAIRSDDVVAFMDSLDVLVHPSLEESFGMVVLEAMGRGLPVVAGEASGGPSWVTDGGRAGVLVDVRSPLDMAGAMRELAEKPDKRLSIAGEALARAGEFRLDRITKEYVRLYQTIIGR